jgi:hypothetical protein
VPLSNQTRHALKVIHYYLAAENEAVQYRLEYMADQVTQTSSGIVDGIQAGNVPANDIVSDTEAQVFEVNTAPTGSPSGSLSLNLTNGELTANWTLDGAAVTVSGEVHYVESLSGHPSDRFLFLIREPGSGFYVLSTTNI